MASKNVSNPPAAPLAVDVRGAAAALSVSSWQIRSLILQKKLVPIRLGRKFVFRVTDIEKFLANEAGEAA